MKLPYTDVFTKLLKNKMEAEFQKKYNEILKHKIEKTQSKK